MERNRYDLSPDRQLPLLSRGERDTDMEDLLNGDKIPSCRELKKMWKLARKLHTKALETNEIPRKSHPFSSFQADRFRSFRKAGGRRKSDREREQKEREQTNLGDKEEDIYGTVNYTPGETVKRPTDSEANG